MKVAVRRTAGTDGDALALVDAMIAELAVVYDAGVGRGSAARPQELAPPHGGFVVLEAGGRAVAGGGIRRIDERTCEVKRMYVVPEARGQGLGRTLLEALEALARDLGYAVARLDTGPEQPGAQRMYERAGYVPVPAYNDNPYATFWGEKRLDARATARSGARDEG